MISKSKYLVILYILIGEGNSNPLQYSCLENPMDQGAWWATIHGVAKSRTRLSDFCVCVCVSGYCLKKSIPCSSKHFLYFLSQDLWFLVSLYLIL